MVMEKLGDKNFTLIAKMLDMNAARQRVIAGNVSNVNTPNTTAVRNNGNNVDIDLEMVNMRQTAALYNIYTQLYNRKASLVKMAISGGP
jgi:flagellar basal body rod protein FlgB